MKRSFKFVVAFLALMIAAAVMPNVAAASGQPMMSPAPSYADESDGPVLDQLAATIEIIIGKKSSVTMKKKPKLKVKIKACPAGQNRDPNSGVCFSCSHNDHFDAAKGRCVPCKAGFHEEGDECVADVTKKKKKKTTTTTSTTRQSCPEGQNADPNTGVCFSCSHNDHFDVGKGRCVPCKQGFHVEGDECVAD